MPEGGKKGGKASSRVKYMRVSGNKSVRQSPGCHSRVKCHLVVSWRVSEIKQRYWDGNLPLHSLLAFWFSDTQAGSGQYGGLLPWLTRRHVHSLMLGTAMYTKVRRGSPLTMRSVMERYARWIWSARLTRWKNFMVSWISRHPPWPQLRKWRDANLVIDWMDRVRKFSFVYAGTLKSFTTSLCNMHPRTFKFHRTSW